MRIYLIAIAACFSVLGQPSAFAAWEKIPSTEFSLPSPPSQAESLREVSELLKLQTNRTDEDCALGEKQAQPDFASLFGDSSLLTKKELKTVAPLLSRVSHLGERVANYFKGKFRRVRPYNFDSRVQPCVTPPGGAKSYPSSHASVSALDACVLGLLIPSSAKDFADLGVSLGDRRKIVGVHFPSDVEAGQNLAKDICDRLASEADFQTEIEKIKRAL